jgi:hypothetical protein
MAQYSISIEPTKDQEQISANNLLGRINQIGTIHSGGDLTNTPHPFQFGNLSAYPLIAGSKQDFLQIFEDIFFHYLSKLKIFSKKKIITPNNFHKGPEIIKNGTEKEKCYTLKP